MVPRYQRIRAEIESLTLAEKVWLRDMLNIDLDEEERKRRPRPKVSVSFSVAEIKAIEQRVARELQEKWRARMRRRKDAPSSQ